MNYKKIYNSLIKRAMMRLNDSKSYYESHHIIPRCIGGTNDISNLVDLSPEEHYIAHLLLVKIYPNNAKLIYAANMMTNRNNKSYGWVKRKFIIQNSLDHKGMKHTDISKKKMSEKRKNVPKSEIHKNNIRKKKLTVIEYKGIEYVGYEELKKMTGISYHLYNKFYKNGIDPEPYVGNNTYAMVEKLKKSPPKAAKGKRWFNNGIIEKYFDTQPDGWNIGRISRNKI